MCILVNLLNKIITLNLKRNEWVRRQTGVRDVVMEIKKAKWRWAGHVIRRTDDRWTERLTSWYPREGKRKRGHPLTRWHDEIKKFDKNWRRSALDRELWRGMGEAFTQQWGTNG